MAHILDPMFRYTPAAQTDIRRTFERVRAEIARAHSEEQRQSAGARHLPGCLLASDLITEADRDCCYCAVDQRARRDWLEDGDARR